ncbi:LLM class flavin-dependent oxidoreductase [Actinacidiphila rubida]|uniref:Luciferase-like monooxygenase n=1 Tax=Actinacidiphila rubida TaxID=310780 RepID=A0A1H8QKG4_9ACTN|nr:LLM class flavin-dependent oxidoreductase [Actinacidiphila rubida]SEO54710.1 Luciferase-like monooxygenase [Actinacidiphila rubida]
MSQRGLEPGRARELTDASIDVIQRLFRREGPFDLTGGPWRGTGLDIGIDWVAGAPPIALSVSGSPESARAAGARGLDLLTAHFAGPAVLGRLGAALVEGQESAGRPAGRDGLRVSRVLFVGDTDRQARDALRASYEAVIAWEIRHTPWQQADRVPPGGSLEDITYDYLVDSGQILVGSAGTVRQMIESLYAEVGGFGVLLAHAGRDYATHEEIRRSMTLLATDVMPKLAHVGAVGGDTPPSDGDERRPHAAHRPWAARRSEARPPTRASRPGRRARAPVRPRARAAQPKRPPT